LQKIGQKESARMPLTCCLAILVMTLPVVSAGCGGLSDPPGTVPPNEGNLGGAAIGGGASSDDASTSSGAAFLGNARGVPPTWTAIYNADLKDGSIGNCVSCHAPMRTASGAYQYLQSTGFINGSSSLLVKNGSCLSWYGGNMPPGGARSNAMVVSDMNAWANAGAMNN
jgi:hypothetical protein